MTRALCESIDSYFRRICDAHTHTVDNNVKVERLDEDALYLVITDIAGNIEDCLSCNSARVRMLLVERSVA